MKFFALVLFSVIIITSLSAQILTDSLLLSEIKNVNFGYRPDAVYFYDGFENGQDLTQWTFEGSYTSTVSTEHHSGSNALLLKGADLDGGISRIITNKSFQAYSGQIEFWFKDVILGSSSYGSHGHFHIGLIDTSNSNWITIGQHIDQGDSLHISAPNNNIKKCGVNLRTLIGWHKMTTSFSYSNSQATIVVSIDDVESVRSTFPYYSPWNKIYLWAGGQHWNTSQAYVDDLLISVNNIGKEYEISLSKTDFWVNKNENVNINGILKKTSGEGIPAKKIRISDACNNFCSEVTTSSDGSFTYNTTASRVGIYQINFDYFGGNDSAHVNALVSLNNDEVIALFKSMRLENVGSSTLTAQVSYKGKLNTSNSNIIRNDFQNIVIEKEYTIPPTTMITIVDGTNLNYILELVDKTPGSGNLGPPNNSIAHKLCPIQLGVVKICGPATDDPDDQVFSVSGSAVITFGIAYNRYKGDLDVSVGAGLGLPYVVNGSAALTFGSNGLGLNVAGGIGFDEWTVKVFNAETNQGMESITMNINSPIDPLFTTPDGKRIGIDPDSGKFINEIPFASYNGPANEPQELIIPGYPVGNYNLTIKGNGNGSYLIQKTVKHNGNIINEQIMDGIIINDSIQSYNLPIDTIDTGLLKPESILITPIDCGVHLEWSATTGAQGYKIYYSNDTIGLPYKGEGANEGNSPIDVGNTSNFNVTGLIPDSVYYFTVTAYDSLKIQGGFSKEETLMVVRAIMNHFSKGWNLISVACNVLNRQKVVLFPTSASNAFSYEGSYVAQDTLNYGTGYWLKFADLEFIDYLGTSRKIDSIMVQEGWNLLGSISDPIAVSSITSDTPGIVTSSFFGYSGSYEISDTIYSGKGYWVKVNQTGKIILSSNALVAASVRIKILPTSEMPPLPPFKENSIANYIPKVFSLAQNYPNPFNPITIIKYGLPEKSNVKLSVFNTLGQRVVLLVDEKQEAGYHEVTLNASGLTSGVYFYRLQAGNFTSVQKMLLVK